MRSSSNAHVLLALVACLVRGVTALSVGAHCGRYSATLQRSPARSTPRMLEVFDLLPVVDCLKLDNMDAVQACMDKLEPWMQMGEGGDITFSLNAVNGFIGGSVGVIGTVVAAQIKKGEVKERLKCVYCDGKGQILCGHCLGSRVISSIGPDGQVVTAPCGNCENTGTVVCINCQGSGLSVPDDFLQVLGDEEVGFTEEDYIGLFDETPIPRGSTPVIGSQQQQPGEPVAAGTRGSEADEATRDEAPRPNDFTGGLG